MPTLYTIRPSPSKQGLGVFATAPIQPGTAILSEAPTLRLPRGKRDVTPAQVAAAFDRLSSADRETYLSLHQGITPYESKLLRILMANSFGVSTSTGEQLLHLYLTISRINHDCNPNAELAGLDEGTRSVVAVRNIEAEIEITISYINVLDNGPREERRDFLSTNYGFTCDCATCRLTGSEQEASDLRRYICSVLSHRLIGRERQGLVLLDDVAGLAPDGAKTYGHRLVPSTMLLTLQDKTRYNWLIAKLLQAEGLQTITTAHSYHQTAFALAGQLAAQGEVFVLPAIRNFEVLLEKAVEACRCVRAEGTGEMREIEAMVRGARAQFEGMIGARNGFVSTFFHP